MDATPNRSGKFAAGSPGLGRLGRARFGTGSASPLAMKWSALHEAAQAVATIAGTPCPPPSDAIRAFPLQVRAADTAHQVQAEQGIEDLATVMEAGLGALLAALARGSHPTAAALALWDTFTRTRDALMGLNLAKPIGNHRPT